MAINRHLFARRATQGAARDLAWRFIAAAFSVAVMNFVLNALVPKIAVFIDVATSVALLWILVRFTYPAMIRLDRHYWRVFDLSVPAASCFAKASVLEQRSALLGDLTLPWRALRG